MEYFKTNLWQCFRKVNSGKYFEIPKVFQPFFILSIYLHHHRTIWSKIYAKISRSLVLWMRVERI